MWFKVLGASSMIRKVLALDIALPQSISINSAQHLAELVFPFRQLVLFWLLVVSLPSY